MRLSSKDFKTDAMTAASLLALVKAAAGTSNKATPVEILDAIDQLSIDDPDSTSILPIYTAAGAYQTLVATVQDFIDEHTFEFGKVYWMCSQGSGYGGGTGGFYAVGGDLGASANGAGSSNDVGLPTSTQLAYSNMSTGATTLNAYCSLYTELVVDPSLWFVSFADVTLVHDNQVRYTFGFAPSHTGVGNNDTPGLADYFLLQFSSLRGDTNWQLLYRQGGGAQNILDTGIPFATGSVRVIFKVVSNTRMSVYIDGVEVASLTAGIPTSGTPMVSLISVANPVGLVDRQLWMSRMGFISEDPAQL